VTCHVKTYLYWELLAFWAFSITWYSKKQRFRNCICFRPQVKGWETPIQLGPSERANLNHCSLEYHTVDNFQKPSNSQYYSPSSEPFRTCNYCVSGYYPSSCFYLKQDMDNVQKHNNCINIPLSQTFRSPLESNHICTPPYLILPN
jgi:hypothetical protein